MEKPKTEEHIRIEEDEIDILEIFSYIKKHIKMIMAITLISTIGVSLITLIMPDIYRAQATILPVSDSQNIPFSELSNVLPLPFQSGGDSKKIIAILQSRYIKEKLVDNLNLVDVIVSEDVPTEKRKEIAIKTLESMTDVKEDRKIGTITISVDYKDKSVAKRIVEAYLNELQTIIDEKAFTKAKMERLSVEKKLKEVEERLKTLQSKLIEFQKKTNLIVPEKQIASSIEVYSSLISEKITLEMELKSLLTRGGSIERITELRNKLREINNKIKEFESKNSQRILLSFKEIPEEMSNYYSILREIRLSQRIYETLLKLYENIRFAEMKEAIYVEIIDPPYTTDEPVKPKRKLIIGIAFISSLFLSIFIALFIEGFINRQRSQRAYHEDVYNRA